MEATEPWLWRLCFLFCTLQTLYFVKLSSVGPAVDGMLRWSFCESTVAVKVMVIRLTVSLSTDVRTSAVVGHLWRLVHGSDVQCFDLYVVGRGNVEVSWLPGWGGAGVLFSWSHVQGVLQAQKVKIGALGSGHMVKGFRLWYDDIRLCNQRSVCSLYTIQATHGCVTRLR